MYKSVNEIDRFSFEDCVLTEISKAGDGLLLSVEALIVKANNSQNENFTESYAGPSLIRFEGGTITSIYKAGFKYYNADGKLIKEVKDEEILKPEWGSLLKSFEGNFLPALEKTDEGFLLEIEMSEEDGNLGNSYLLNVKSEKVFITWEHYMNRVQR